jgi:hypothetical protein
VSNTPEGSEMRSDVERYYYYYPLDSLGRDHH